MSARLSRVWAQVYTAGLDGPGARRREEIESDLVDHQTARADDGWEPGRVTRERISRTLRGMPADIAWRRDVLTARPRRAGVLTQGSVIAVTTVASLLLAGFYVAFGLYISGRTGLADERFLGGFDNYLPEVDRPVASVVTSTVIFGLALVMLLGAVLRPVAPFFANVSTTFVAMPAVLFFWLGSTPIAAVVVLGSIADMFLRAPNLSTRQ